MIAPSRLTSTPGHTEGSICLLGEIDDRDVLFAGDTVGGAMRSLDGASLELWAAAIRVWTDSLRRLSSLDFEWVLNGHEPATSLPISRPQFDRMVARFGTMLNPWFSLGTPNPAPERTDDDHALPASGILEAAIGS